MTDTLVPITEGDARRDALIKAVGFDKLSEPQRELALAIAQRYELDPMLKHVVMIEGRPYITRDGLLHVAHRSGVFDGIEVSDPVLDDQADAAGRRYWRARCSVWRKDFARPFVYPGRYPVQGGNAKYAEEMAVKVAEVMTLRRAFDVSAPTVEERWDGDLEEHQPVEQPASLAERALLRAAEIERARLVSGDSEDDGTYTGAAQEAVAVVEQAVAEEEELRDAEPVRAQNALEAFSEWASSQDRQEIIAASKRLFPDITRFSDLQPEQLEAIQAEVERAGEEADALAELEAIKAQEPQAPDAPVVAQDAPGGAEPVEAESAAAPEPAPSPGAFQPPVLCGAVSPLSGASCTLDAGHKSATHRAGLKEAW